MRIVMLEPIGLSLDQIEALRDAFLDPNDELVIATEKILDPEAQRRQAENADVLILANSPLSPEALRDQPQLTFISVAFTGVDHIPLELCSERGILVSNCAGYATHAVAELVFTMIGSLFRSLPEADRATREGRSKDGLRLTEIHGKTLGIVGYGAIGQRVAELGRAFGCEILVYHRRPLEDAPGVRQVTLDELCRMSDIVTLHVPLTDDTRHMIDAERLGQMKPDAILINTARGPVVDNQALATCLREGRIRGAGIDVFDQEPPLPEDDPLRDAPRTMLAPHIGFATAEAMVKRGRMVFENIAQWKRQTPVRVMNQEILSNDPT